MDNSNIKNQQSESNLSDEDQKEKDKEKEKEKDKEDNDNLSLNDNKNDKNDKQKNLISTPIKNVTSPDSKNIKEMKTYEENQNDKNLLKPSNKEINNSNNDNKQNENILINSQEIADGLRIDNSIKKRNLEENTNTNTYSKGINTCLDSQVKNESTILISLVGKDKKLTASERDYVRDTLGQHYLFKDIGNEIITTLINEIQVIKYPPKFTIYTEKDLSENFYLIKEGSVSETKQNNQQSKTYKEGDTFGELSLIEKKQWKSNVITIESTICYVLEGHKFRDIVHKLNQNQLKERLNFVSLVPIFQTMNNTQLNAITTSMLTCTFDIGQKIFNEGEIGYCFYIIRSGEVSCEENNKVIRLLGANDFFGEYALLFDIPRTLTAKAKTKVNAYEISNVLLEDALGNDYKEIILRSILKASFKKDKLFSIISDDSYIADIFENSEIISINNEEQIKLEEETENINIEDSIFQRDDNKILYCIIIGNFVNKKKNIVAKRGELFGSSYFEKEDYKNKKDMNIFAQGECRAIKILWKDIIKALGLTNKTIKAYTFFEQLNLMKKNNLFENASNYKLIKICSVMKKEKYEPEEIIFEENTPANKFYMIKKGTVKILKDGKKLREFGKGSCFGEIALLRNELRTATLQAKEKCTLYVLEKEDFDKNIDQNMLAYLNNKMALQDNQSLNSIDNFYYCKKLGQGKFGEVSLVHNNKYFYAIKCVNRKSAEKQKILIKYFLEERRLLLILDHPFIMKLVKTFKTEDSIFYLTEFVNGKGLSDYLSSKPNNTFRNKYEVQFYIAILFIILDYLNSKSIAHRDLKPDNIMINSQGYIKVIDFGTARIIKDFTSTLTGTPYYIGPEVLKGKGYGFSCDYWSVGVMAYEIYYNSYPFGNDANDPMEVYRETIKKDLSLPYKGDKNVNSFIKAVLTKNVAKRLCTLEAAKKHPLFKDMNWNDLIDFHMRPPFIPEPMKIKTFKDYTEKYLVHLENELKSGKSKKKVTVLSSYDNDEDSESYPVNWADEF